jgi:hypothetical protein
MEPRVKELIENYTKGNLKQVYEYLTGPKMTIDPNTWSGKIKEMIEKHQYNSAKQLIELTAYKFITLKNTKHE